MIRTATINELVERYTTCPYCEAIISDNHTGACYDSPMEDMTEGKITCPKCKKAMMLKW